MDGGMLVNVVLSTLNAKYIHSSLALRYLAAYCQAPGRTITVREYTVNNTVLEIVSDLYACQAQVVGLACYIWNIEMTLQLAALIKKVQPQAIIVLGGPEASYQPEDILSVYTAVDYIVLGEGEQAMNSLLAKLSAGEQAGSIPGVVCRQQSGIGDRLPQQVARLDDIPFPYTTEGMAALKDKILYYESSRGCPFACQYCLSSATAGVRFLSLERVFNDLQFFIAHDVKQVKFVDRTFNARKEHYFPILKFLAKQTCRTNFHFEIAADCLDEEVVEFLRQVPPGRFQFEIGIQSTHKQTLTAIKRNNNWQKIANYCKQIKSYGNIHLHLDVIVGLPYENLELFAKSFDDVYGLQPDMLQIGFLKLLKGSGIRREAASHGYVAMDTAPYEVLANNYMDYATIRQLKILEEVFEQMYNSGRFRCSLPWFITLAGGGAFSFYRQLADYWEQHGYQLTAHSAKNAYKYLADFCLALYPQAKQECCELLKFDALMSEQATGRPEFLPWNQVNQAANDQWAEHKTAFWRNAERVHRYLPDFTFSTWREIKKTYHIEIFQVDIPNYLKNAESLAKREIAVLFSYQNKKTSYQVINDDDFWS